MRQIAMLCLCLTLVDCSADKPWRDSSLGGPRPLPHEDGPVMRRLLGQDPGVEPLLPEPGDIWADVVPKEAPAARTKAALERPADRPHVAAQLTAQETPPPDPADVPNPPRPLHSIAVQLVAAGSAKRAEAEWKQLWRRMPKLMPGHQPAVTAADVDGRRVWRLRADGFATVAEANAFCASVRAVNSNCWVVGP